jgi:S-adenosylmethionine-diacylglycerol 3-amino-3-carboxypropyl transferase
VVFRTGGATSPLERMLPADILAAWRTDPEHNRRLHASDRSAIYGGMHLYERV